MKKRVTCFHWESSARTSVALERWIAWKNAAYFICFFFIKGFDYNERNNSKGLLEQE